MPLNSIGWTSISCQGCPALICCQQRSSSPQQQQWSYTQTRRWSGRADRSRSLALRCYAQQALTLSAADLERAGSAHSLQSLLAPDEAQARLLGSWAARGRHPQQDAAGRLLLKNLTYSELEEWCLATGERLQRARHLWRWMYHDGLWMRSLEQTVGRQDAFGPAYREKAAPLASVEGGLQLLHTQRSSDGTQKLVFLAQGSNGTIGTIETVLIPVFRESRNRLTICVSSQVGCAMNCQFCFTGRMGLRGNLSTAQIVEQVVEARRLLAAQSAPARPQPITNLVFMGMGEPLDNLSAVLPAIEILTHPLGLHFGAGRVTVSTVGLVPQVRQLVASTRAVLAVSLHATTDEVRDWICPVNRRWPLASLLGALQELFPRRSPTASLPSPAPRHAQKADSPAEASSSDGLRHPDPPPALHSADPAQSSHAHTAAELTVQTSDSLRVTTRNHSSSSNQSPGSVPARVTDQSSNPRSQQQTRHVLFEYVMLRGVNDALQDAHRLLLLTRGIECKFNLIEFNAHPGTHFRGSDSETIQSFRSVLIQGGRVCTVRQSRGDDELAACGQLGGELSMHKGSEGPHMQRHTRAPPLLVPPDTLKASIEA